MPDQPEVPDSAQSTRGDAFYVLRDCRELFQQRLGEIARLAGVSSPSVLAAFTREVGEVHDELASAAQQDGFEQTAGLTASRISLVGNDDLELEIRIGDIVSRLKGNDRIDHWRAQLRYKTLLHRPKMTMGNNPVGLEPIGLGLWAICKESGSSLDQTLIVLDRLEEQLQLQLPDFYVELNALLERHGIEPAQVQPVQRERSPVTRAEGGATGNSINPPASNAAAGNALAALQQSMQNQFGGEHSSAGEPSTGNVPAQGGNFTLNAATLLMLNQLMERLRVLELQQVTGLADFSLDEPDGSELDGFVSSDPAKSAPLRALKSKDLDVPLGKSATIAMDTLSLIFESLFTAPDLPHAVKLILSRLQIPLLKLAILDTAFFADTQHPARRLVNRMARAATGLNQDVDRDHPVCAFLLHISDAVRATLETGEGQITPHLDELDAFIQQRDQSLQASARSYVQLVQAHEADEAARIAVQDWLGKTRTIRLEPAIDEFLATHWLRVMHGAYLDGGPSGPRWKEGEKTIQELLWSIRPKASAEDRKKLLALIPSLLKRINAELDRLSLPSEARTPFFDACFELQTASLRQASPLAETPLPPTAVTPPKPISTTVHVLEQSGKLVQYCGLLDAPQAARRSGIPPWKDGDWLFFNLPDGERLCGCCCGQYAPFGTLVLFNPEWGFAVALAPALLEQQLRSSQARIVSESSLFDEAAERALAQMAAH